MYVCACAREDEKENCRVKKLKEDKKNTLAKKKYDRQLNSWEEKFKQRASEKSNRQ